MSANQDRAWSCLEALSFTRVSGSEGEKRAAEYFKKVCDDLGVKAAVETYEFENATVHSAGLRIREGKEYRVFGIAYSGNTPLEGITAPFRYINTGDQEADLLDISGKIALVAPGGTSTEKLKKLKELGAVAFIAIHGGFYDDDVIANGPRVRALNEASHVELPGVSLHMRDAKELVCLHSDAELTLSIHQTPGVLTGYNTVAEIPGTELPGEAVVLSSHCDTVIHSPGSWDNGTGCVTLLEALHYFKAHPPKRTVRFLWCGSEECGAYGSRTYCEEHKEDLEKTIFNINVDMLGTPLTRTVFCGSAHESVTHFTEFYAKLKGWPMKCEVGFYSSDSSIFAMAGVPSCSFGQEMSGRGGAEIHNYRDTLEQVHPQTLAESIAFVLEYTEMILNARVNPIRKGFPAKVQEGIDAWTKSLADMPLRKKQSEAK